VSERSERTNRQSAPGPKGTQQNEQAVRDFLNAWNEPKKLGDFFAEDAIFQMMARDPH
jgi:hypothetical protein